MTTYANGDYRVGHQGYCGFKGQTAALVAPGATVDPVPLLTGAVGIGPCAVPGYDRNEGTQPVETAQNLGRDLEHTPGRREDSLRTTVSIADGSYFTDTFYAVVRDRVNPAAVGLRKGLQLHSIYYGIDGRFSNEHLTHVGVDCLLNSVGFNYAEGQPLTANVDWWPTAVIEMDGDITAAAPTGSVLNWGHLWISDSGGVDYHPIAARVSVQISNSLQRIGQRKEIWADGAIPGEFIEQKISRTAYSIEPGLEKVQISMTLHDLLPSTMRRQGKWTESGGVALRLYAAHPAAGYVTTRRYFQIDLGDICLSREGMQEVAAGRPFSWSTDLASIGVSITAGVVT